jgi:hypothetical protein
MGMERPLWGYWQEIRRINARRYTCGFCNSLVASDRAYVATSDPSGGGLNAEVHICPHCNRPTFFGDGVQVPGVAFGNPVPHVKPDVDGLYGEARKSTTVGAHTLAVMGCRKILMNVAVDKGAAEGLKFEQYVDYLAAQNYVPPGGKGWVDRIRKIGNAANHKIPSITKEQAEEILSFTEMLLRFVYELPGRVPKPAKGKP